MACLILKAGIAVVCLPDILVGIWLNPTTPKKRRLTSR
jgi:hypothetical protein